MRLFVCLLCGFVVTLSVFVNLGMVAVCLLWFCLILWLVDLFAMVFCCFVLGLFSDLSLLFPPALGVGYLDVFELFAY